MGQRDGGDQRGFCSAERVGGGGGPIEGFRTAPKEVGQRPQRCGNPRQKSSVKVYHAEELLQLFDRGWRWEFLNGLYMGRQRTDAVFINHVAQEFHRSGGKDAFTWINHQAVVLQHLEELGKVFHVFFQCSAGDQVIIQVSENKRKFAEQTVHQPLECLSSIHETKWHEKILKQSKRCDDGRFLHICRRHRHLMVSLYQVND
jgi:hypothetical protein